MRISGITSAPRWLSACTASRMAASGFKRSAVAVHLKMKRLRIKSNLDGYSAHQLAEAFGVDGHKVTAWIRAGLLKSELRGTAKTASSGGDIHFIRREDVRRFILSSPDEYDLRKVEKFWFLDVITEGKICR
jgi:hypothetical protein